MGSLKQREAFLDRVDLVRRLNQVGEQRRAALLHHDLGSHAEDLLHKSMVAELAGSAQARHARSGRVAALSSDLAKALAPAPPRRKIATKQKPRKGYTKLERRRVTKKAPPRYVPV